MKKFIYILFASMLCWFMASCEETETYDDLVPSDELYFPRDKYTVDLSTGKDIILEWKSSGEGFVVYEVVFDTETGDFSNPLYVILSANNGASPNVTVSSSTLNSIALKAGCLPGSTVTLKWTVRVWKGAESALYDESRNISVTRANTVSPLPIEVSVSGTATENDEAIELVAATPVSSTKGSPSYVSQVQREIGGFECFTRLDAGDFTVTDDQGRYFRLDESGSILQAEEGTVTENTEAGIYYLYLDFNTMKWKKNKIEKVEFSHRPWWHGEGYNTEMTYEGNGVWSLVDNPWGVSDGGNYDSRYYFLCTYAGGSVERWGHFEDDCRQSDNADNVEGFFNVYRFNNATLPSDNYNWLQTWKVHEGQKEGANQLATFRLYMNNENSEDYYHERSFRDK